MPTGPPALRPLARSARTWNRLGHGSHFFSLPLGPTRDVRGTPTLGARIIEGPEQAIAWTRGENDNVRATLVHVPEVDVREVRTKMGLSQARFATKFGIHDP